MTTLPLALYVISLFASWFCLAESAPGECVCGFVAFLWAAGQLVDLTTTANLIRERLLGAICLFTLLWPPVYWYLSICWICWERPAKKTFGKFNKVLLSLSAVGAAGALAAWFIGLIYGGGTNVQPAFLIASFTPLVSSLLLQFRLSKYSW